jgi:hypothetical protein
MRSDLLFGNVNLLKRAKPSTLGAVDSCASAPLAALEPPASISTHAAQRTASANRADSDKHQFLGQLSHTNALAPGTTGVQCQYIQLPL